MSQPPLIIHRLNQAPLVGVESDGPDSALAIAMYAGCRVPPRFPVPAVSLQVVWPDPTNSIGYKDMIFIDDVSDPDDPIMVCCWDFYNGSNAVNGGVGIYTNMDPRY